MSGSVNMRLVAWFFVLVQLLAGGIAAAAEISGRAQVIDGDTLQISAVLIRLHGIDAPEYDQTCKQPDGGDWNCGARAALRLEQLIDGRSIRCVARDRDRFGRIVATCYRDLQDLGAQIVDEGLAWAFTEYTDRYSGVEASAKTSQIGLWRSPTTPAWDYRREDRPTADPTIPPDPDCAIKGNINAAGSRLYHLPGTRWYARTKINPGRGQRWFCTEQDARAAGWRPAGGG